MRNSNNMTSNRSTTTINNENVFTMNLTRVQELLKTEGNSICADCHKHESKFVDLTFGLFLCAVCSSTHKFYFLNMPERIKSVYQNSFSNDEVNILALGGNNNFNEFIRYYGINSKQTNIEQKYLYEAILYYINLLYHNALGLEFKDTKPDIKEGSKPISYKSIIDYRGIGKKIMLKLGGFFSNKISNEEKTANFEIIKELKRLDCLGVDVNNVATNHLINNHHVEGKKDFNNEFIHSNEHNYHNHKENTKGHSNIYINDNKNHKNHAQPTL